MKMLRYHTLNYLTENIYTMNDSYSEEAINYELTSFFDKLMNRRRGTDIEDGLQAGGVIFDDRAGFKISERDGHASHAQTQENVSQYLNGESAFSSEEAVGMISSRRKDPNLWANITKNGFTVRVVATKETLIFIFNTDKYKITEFQIDVIYGLFKHIKQAYDDGTIKHTYVNYATSRNKLVFNEHLNIDEQLERLEEHLLKQKESFNKKTR